MMSTQKAPTILHQDLDLIGQGQGAQLGHGQDIARGHRFVSVRNKSIVSEAAGREPWRIVQPPLLTSPPLGWVASTS